jgi:methylated-DNA-protein-cysteine methyltransferase related protein
MAPSDFHERVTRVVASLAPGEVVTYGEVAREAGAPGAARAVGNLLRGTDGRLPWWRVVAADGRLVPGIEVEHRAHLEAEGVEVRAGRVAGMRGRRSRRAGRDPSGGAGAGGPTGG